MIRLEKFAYTAVACLFIFMFGSGVARLHTWLWDPETDQDKTFHWMHQAQVAQKQVTYLEGECNRLRHENVLLITAAKKANQ